MMTKVCIAILWHAWTSFPSLFVVTSDVCRLHCAACKHVLCTMPAAKDDYDAYAQRRQRGQEASMPGSSSTRGA